MCNITNQDLRDSNNPVVKSFFANNEFVNTLIDNHHIYRSNATVNDSGSLNSFCLKSPTDYGARIPILLENVFGIPSELSNLFRQKYLEAVSGDGQEWTRITTLHSSSLLALLVFYSVSEQNPLHVGKYTFTSSYFEVKTHVYENSESNMDIVLRGFDYEKYPVVLFLESKFSEYFNVSDYLGISSAAYYNTYNRLGLIDGRNVIAGLKFSGDDCTALSITKTDRNCKIYCGGIKQLLSHYIGVSNYSANRSNALGNHNSYNANTEERIILGEIIFDFAGNLMNIRTQNSANDKKRQYSEAFKALSSILNRDKQIIVLDEILTYQSLLDANPVFNNNLPEKVKQFYKFI